MTGMLRLRPISSLRQKTECWNLKLYEMVVNDIITETNSDTYSTNWKVAKVQEGPSMTHPTSSLLCRKVEHMWSFCVQPQHCEGPDVILKEEQEGNKWWNICLRFQGLYAVATWVSLFFFIFPILFSCLPEFTLMCTLTHTFWHLIFWNTHMQHLQYCHSLTGAAPTALPVVHSGVEPIEVSRQSEV